MGEYTEWRLLNAGEEVLAGDEVRDHPGSAWYQCHHSIGSKVAAGNVGYFRRRVPPDMDAPAKPSVYVALTAALKLLDECIEILRDEYPESDPRHPVTSGLIAKVEELKLTK